MAGTLKVGFPSIPGFSHVPALMAIERLKARNLNAEPVFLANDELVVAATIQGDVNVMTGGADTMYAVQQGFRIRTYGEENLLEYVLVARKALTSCESLNGKRVAYHSEGSTTAALTRAWIKQTCSGTPEYLVMEGSENRFAALLAGQIDGTALELNDWVALGREAPGEFNLLAPFATDLRDIFGNAFWSTEEYIAANRALVVEFMTEILKVHREIAANPQALIDAAKKHLTEIDPEHLPAIAQAYLDVDGFPQNGGLTLERIQASIEFTESLGEIEPGLTPEQISDLTILEDALAAVGGRIADKP